MLKLIILEAKLVLLNEITIEQMNKKLKILITNDDGIDSPGLKELAIALSKTADLLVVAPDRQRSAISQAMTIAAPLMPHSLNVAENIIAYAVNGTPVDCVKLGVSSLMKEKPDLICAGINLGPNTSVSVAYSGTVAAAMEGVVQGIPSIAFSLNSFSYNQDFKSAANYAYKILNLLIKEELPKDLLLNVNIPSLAEQEIKGIKVTHLSNSKWIDAYQKRIDPFGREYYWFSGEFVNFDSDANSDDNALKNGFVSISPIKVNYYRSEYSSLLEKIFL